ncbi:MAG: O-antigen polymerase [Clostridium sp.]|uniref:O-antigen polymerase n=1 Tax=Clostridium sp. TaxID=1506 RepID=UPI003D6D5019
MSHNYIEENSTAYSLTAYLKYAFISMYLFYIYKYGFNKMLMFLLVLQIILMFFDGARTTFFCIAISTICIYNLEYKPRKLKVLLILGLSLFVIISARAVIMKSTFIGNFVDSINIEAQVGSYMVRQTIYIQSVNESYTFGKTYILDPIMYFLDPITKVLFNKPLRGDLYFDRWINNNSIFLLERYAPMGGFYYISEAIITLPYIGAMIITLMYAIFSVYMENNKNKFRSQYILFLALAPLFIKYKFSNFFTMSLVIIILYYIWGFFDRKNNIKYK